MMQEDIFEWQFAVHGPKDSEFEGGIYHGRITLPPEYPFKPPSFMLLTVSDMLTLGAMFVGVVLVLPLSLYSSLFCTGSHCFSAAKGASKGAACCSCQAPVASERRRTYQRMVQLLHYALPPRLSHAPSCLLAHGSQAAALRSRPRSASASPTTTQSIGSHLGQVEAHSLGKPWSSAACSAGALSFLRCERLCLVALRVLSQTVTEPLALFFLFRCGHLHSAHGIGGTDRLHANQA